MSENLWEVRRRKKMKVRDLAAKSGVPASLVHQYEAGETAISQAHLRQLARALIVETWDIKPLSDPKPRTRRAPSTPAGAPGSPPGAPGTQMAPSRPHPPKEKVARPPAPARPSQIEHLLNLAEHFVDVDRASIEAQAGKSLEELTKSEASELLKQLQERMRQDRPPRIKQPYDRHRAYLPEGVDEFELKYLTSVQETGDMLYVTLFDGSQLDGRVIGFSPYTITLSHSGGEETTINKLAIAYYRRHEA